MIKVSVMYSNRDGATFDMDYYIKSHMALVRRLLGDDVKGLAVDQGLADAAGPPRYLAMGHLMFDSVDAFRSAMTAHGPALMADIANYTNCQPVIQVSEMKL